MAHPEVLPVALVAAAVLLANAPVLIGVVTTNPTQLFAELVATPSHGTLPGLPTIDPNAGFITLSMGHLAVSDWLHGHVPWWNPYEGLGAPLAGEMQSAAFFPPVVLMQGALGFVWFHVVLELVAGVATCRLARRLRLGRAPATMAGIAFGLCGTFAWLTNATANPVAFLPLMVLGVERCLDRGRSPTRGLALLAVAVALSITAGFPEMAYLEGLLVGLWAVVRLAMCRQGRLPALGRVAGGALVGALLAAPVLVAFADYLPVAAVGRHSGTFATSTLAWRDAAHFLLPYGYGPIFAFVSTTRDPFLTSLWGTAGGYLDASLVCLALIGAAGRRLRPLRLALVLWVVAAAGKIFGPHAYVSLVNHLPGMSRVAAYRYLPASVSFAVVVLAAFGLDDARRGRLPLGLPIGATVATAAAAVGSAWVAWPELTHAVGAAHRHLYAVVSAAVAVAVAAGLAAGLVRRRHRPGRWAVVAVAAVTAAEAMALFATPFLSAPSAAPVDTAAVSFLQRAPAGTRIYTLGPLQPNFGSLYHLSELDVNDLPVPKAFAAHITTSLDTNVSPLIFTGGTANDPNQPGPAAQLEAHLPAYLADGVSEVVVPASGTDFTGVPWPSPGTDARLVYRDRVMRIYVVRGAAPLVSASAGCRLQAPAQGPTGTLTVTARCRRPGRLVYRELDMPGWSATVAGRSEAVDKVGLFQSVALPGGTARVVVSFRPPHETAAWTAAGLGLVGLAAGAVLGLRRARSRRAPAR